MSIDPHLIQRITELRSEIIELSSRIHAHPELGYQEFKAAELLEERLREHGFQVERPLRNYPTALRACFKMEREGPAIGFIAEYDALPQIGHGCGHNLIAASAFGAAVALAELLKKSDQNLGGSIWVFGTPAEETDGGKIPMLEEGLFDYVDLTMMTHPESLFLVQTSALALDALQFQFKGKASHAASTPHEGINALDAMIQLFTGINALRQQLRPDARVHGIITHGGTAPNIIPDFTEARFYVRSNERSYLNQLTARVKKIAEGAALATGCTVEISHYERSLDNVVNNPVLSRLIEKQLRSLGIKNFKECDDVPGSTDYGNVSQKVPSIYFYSATAPEGSDLHTEKFAQLSNSPLAHEGILVAIHAMAQTGLELFRSPELVSEAKALHQSQKAQSSP